MDSHYPCGWQWAYAESPGTFDAFSRAEDPDGLAIDALLSHANFAGKRVLEIGCGTGRWSAQLAAAGGAQEWIATEPSREMLEMAKRRDDAPASLIFHQAKAQAIALPNDSIDAVFAGWVLGYLKPAVFDEALAEAQRLLRPGGSIWAFENGVCKNAPLKQGHVLQAVPQDARNIGKLQSAGFKVVASISTHLQFPNQQAGQETLDTLFSPHPTPAVGHNGQTPHTICVWRL